MMWLSDVYDNSPYQEQGGDGFQVKASDKALQQVLGHISPRTLYSMYIYVLKCILKCILKWHFKTRLGWLWRIGSFWQTVLTLTKMKWSVKPITIEPLIWECPKNETKNEAFIWKFVTTNEVWLEPVEQRWNFWPGSTNSIQLVELHWRNGNR